VFKKYTKYVSMWAYWYECLISYQFLIHFQLHIDHFFYFTNSLNLTFSSQSIITTCTFAACFWVLISVTQSNLTAQGYATLHFFLSF
jgi:hypothetical protein